MRAEATRPPLLLSGATRTPPPRPREGARSERRIHRDWPAPGRGGLVAPTVAAAPGRRSGEARGSRGAPIERNRRFESAPLPSRGARVSGLFAVRATCAPVAKPMPCECPRHESNMRTRFRKPLLYPLSYGGAGTRVLRRNRGLAEELGKAARMPVPRAPSVPSGDAVKNPLSADSAATARRGTAVRSPP